MLLADGTLPTGREGIVYDCNPLKYEGLKSLSKHLLRVSCVWNVYGCIRLKFFSKEWGTVCTVQYKGVLVSLLSMPSLLT